MTLIALFDAYLAAENTLIDALRADDVRDEYDPRVVTRTKALDALREALAAAGVASAPRCATCGQPADLVCQEHGWTEAAK